MKVILCKPTQRQIEQDRRKAQLDYETLIEEARAKGYAEGYAEGYAKGYAEGQMQIIQLVNHLLAQDRLDDIKRFAKDKAYRDRLLDEFHLT